MAKKNPPEIASGVLQQRSGQPAPKLTVTATGKGVSAQRAQETRDVLGKHVAELTGHTVDSALYNSHGHLLGRQGPRGHDMVRSDLDKQAGQYIPQAMGKDGGPGFDDPCQKDYGTVDTDNSND